MCWYCVVAAAAVVVVPVADVVVLWQRITFEHRTLSFPGRSRVDSLFVNEEQKQVVSVVTYLRLSPHFLAKRTGNGVKMCVNTLYSIGSISAGSRVRSLFQQQAMPTL